MNTLTPSPAQHFRVINALQLNGYTFAADVMLMLYLHDHPNGPRPASKAPVRNPVQVERQRAKDSHNPFHNDDQN